MNHQPLMTLAESKCSEARSVRRSEIR